MPRVNKYRDEADARKLAYREGLTTQRREPVLKEKKKREPRNYDEPKES